MYHTPLLLLYNTTARAGAPPPDLEPSSQLVSLERSAAASGNGDVAFNLQRASMAFIKAHASRRQCGRQT